MIILDTNRSLVCILSAAKTTNDMDFVCSYGDHGTGFVTGVADGTTNGLTEATMIAAPVAGKRLVKSFMIFNNDTVAQTITIKTKNGSTYRVIQTVTLFPNESLTYTEGKFEKFLAMSKEQGLYTLSVDQTTDLSVGNAVKFDTANPLSNIAFNTGTFTATLKAGMRYKIDAACRFGMSAAGFCAIKIQDTTNAVQIGIRGIGLSTTYASHYSSQPTAMGFISCITATNIRAEIILNTNTTSIATAYSFLKIESF